MEIKLFLITHVRLYFIILFISTVIFSVSSSLGGYAKDVEHPSDFFFCFVLFACYGFFCKYSFVMCILPHALVMIFVTRLMYSAPYPLIYLDALGDGNLGLN